MEKMVMTSKDKRLLIYSLFIILIVSCFTGWFYYINEPLNEDLGGYFNPDGSLISTFSHVISKLARVYIGWSGRIPGYFLIYFSKLFPRSIQAIAVAVIFSSNVIIAKILLYFNYN